MVSKRSAGDGNGRGRSEGVISVWASIKSMFTLLKLSPEYVYP